MTTIDVTLTPPNPLTDSQATFNSKSLAFTQALTPWAEQANTVASEVNADKAAAAGSAVSAANSVAAAEGQVTLAEAEKTAAQGHAAAASNSAALAASSAASAVNAPGTSATSTTPRTIGPGALSLTIETGKAYAIGQFVVIASTASPGNYMSGQIASYSAGTGSLSVNVERVGGSGSFSAWTVSVVGAPGAAAIGGANVQSISSDLTLTAMSVQVHALAATAQNLSIILPDATTLNEGGTLYVIENVGEYAIAVRDSTGILKTIIRPWQIGACHLKDSTTAAGSWAFGSQKGGELGGFLNNTAVVTHTGTNAPQYAAVVQLSPTTALYITTNGTTTGYAYVLTISGSSISVGAAYTFTITSGAFLRAVRLTDTTALLTSGVISASSLFAGVLTVSGTTVTLGAMAETTVFSNIKYGPSLAQIDATRILIAGKSITANSYAVQIASVSGGTVTFGTVYTAAPGTIDTVSAAVLTDSLCVVSVGYGVGTNMLAIALAISGTSLTTAGAPVPITITKGPAYPVAMGRVSDTACVMVGLQHATINQAFAVLIQAKLTSIGSVTMLTYAQLLALDIPASYNPGNYHQGYVHLLGGDDLVIGYVGYIPEIANYTPLMLQRVRVEGDRLVPVTSKSQIGIATAYWGQNPLTGLPGADRMLALLPSGTNTSAVRVVEVA